MWSLGQHIVAPKDLISCEEGILRKLSSKAETATKKGDYFIHLTRSQTTMYSNS